MESIKHRQYICAQYIHYWFIYCTGLYKDTIQFGIGYTILYVEGPRYFVDIHGDI